MNEKTQGSGKRRKNADVVKGRPVFDKMMDRRNNNTHINELDKQNKIQSETNSQIFHTETTVDSRDQILPQTNSHHQFKRYSRTLSETSVGYRPLSNTAKLKRVLSATELRTRLASCPKGLLITTEPPKSGETYRRRANTDVKAILGKKDRSLNDELPNDTSLHQEEINWLREKKATLLELEETRRERGQLQKENERLHEELENRNKVIDHLIDFMKSSLPGESIARESEQFGDDLDDTNNNLNRTQSIEKV